MPFNFNLMNNQTLKNLKTKSVNWLQDNVAENTLAWVCESHESNDYFHLFCLSSINPCYRSHPTALITCTVQTQTCAQVAQTHTSAMFGDVTGLSPQESSSSLCHTLTLRMKCAALVASLVLRVLSCPGATGESCHGKTVDVFLDSSFISDGDYIPDTYVKVGNIPQGWEDLP